MSHHNQQYPDGKLNAEDEGVLAIAIGVEEGLVRVDFGKPVAWFAVPADLAKEIAQSLLKHARNAAKKRGRKNTHWLFGKDLNETEASSDD